MQMLCGSKAQRIHQIPDMYVCDNIEIEKEAINAVCSNIIKKLD